MSLNNNIQNALTTQLSGVSGLPEIAYANINFSSSQGTPFVKPSLIPARSKLYSLEEELHQGIYQVDIYTPIDKGTAPILLIADSIRDSFKNQNTLVSDTDTIYIQEISISKTQQMDGWWNCFVEINYICFN